MASHRTYWLRSEKERRERETSYRDRERGGERRRDDNSSVITPLLQKMGGPAMRPMREKKGKKDYLSTIGAQGGKGKRGRRSIPRKGRGKMSSSFAICSPNVSERGGNSEKEKSPANRGERRLK